MRRKGCPFSSFILCRYWFFIAVEIFHQGEIDQGTSLLDAGSGCLFGLGHHHLKLKEGMGDLLLDARAERVEEGKGLVFEFEEGILLADRAEVHFGAQMIDLEQVVLP